MCGWKFKYPIRPEGQDPVAPLRHSKQKGHYLSLLNFKFWLLYAREFRSSPWQRQVNSSHQSPDGIST